MKEKEKVLIVIYRPGDQPTQIMLEPTKENFNRIVGGNLDFVEFPAPKGGKIISIGYNRHWQYDFWQYQGVKMLQDEAKKVSLCLKGPYFVCGEVLKLGEKLELLGLTTDCFERVRRICY